MIVVHGVEKARPLLSREPSLKSVPLSPNLADSIRQVFGRELTAEQVVENIITRVHSRGDAALFELAQQIDHTQLTSLEVSREEIKTAYKFVDDELLSALRLAAGRIRSFHLASKREDGISLNAIGLGQRVLPLDRVGVYVPGGTACYPSTVLMTVIPARIAGIREVIMTSPPGQGGNVPSPTLVAADIAGVDRLFKIGGAQAIAALALGTETIPRVDKICGPGNIFVMLAKKMVFGMVDIDGLQGPTEVVIIADETADPSICAADLLSQAEHDPLASAILITTSPGLALEVNQEIPNQMRTLGRQDIISESVDNKGMIVVVERMDECIELANLFAPEHLLLAVRDAHSLIQRISNAGCVFIGQNSAVALGDYAAGPSHVLPTGGTARFSSPLGVADFCKVTNLIDLSKEMVEELGPATLALARAEGLAAHARSVELRLRKEEIDC